MNHFRAGPWLFTAVAPAFRQRGRRAARIDCSIPQIDRARWSAAIVARSRPVPGSAVHSSLGTDRGSNLGVERAPRLMPARPGFLCMRSTFKCVYI
ncbi:hypothetical protein MRX96_008947 [Rhipicephalus microplus]